MRFFLPKLVCVLFVSFVLVSQPAFAEITVNIGPHSSGPFSASSFHSADTGTGGDVMSGTVTKSLVGTLVGDLNEISTGSVIDVTGGSIQGQIGNMANYLGNALGLSSSNTDHLFKVTWSDGQLKFYNAHDSGPPAEGLVGGWLDYQVSVSTDGGTSFTDVTTDDFDNDGSGTMFFAPEDFGFNNNQPGPNQWIGPNIGKVTSFTLWGNNWQATKAGRDWSFLSGGVGHEGLSYDGPSIDKDDLDGIYEFGTDLNGDVPGGFNSVPEPTTFIMWSVLGVAGLFVTKRRRK